ncbi:MAG TPA: aldo/keto reductase [Aggregatilineales bacterium]|nr:aldo/keto reductase [Aggregatilineales bacterium]
MEYRQLGRTDMRVATVSFGAWAIGGSWGTTQDDESLAALRRAADLGVNFIDTADVYGDGRSEQLVARLRKERPHDKIYVATKAGRRLPRQVASGYTRANLTDWVDRSLRNLQMDALDLLQLHCPAPEVYDRPEVFSILDDLVKAGKLRYYGVSVETVEEALKAMRYPNVQAIQIIFNMFRLKPAEEFFAAAKAKQVGILARVPLASGLLTGKMTSRSTFEADDHRAYNRNGESFDKGETFSGVPFEQGLQAVEALKAIKPAGMSMAQFALRWILMFDAVTCTIPGAKRPSQAEDNCAAADLPPLSPETMQTVQDIYSQYVREAVHTLW